jgi:phosphoribosylformylglycinamidine synthase
LKKYTQNQTYLNRKHALMNAHFLVLTGDGINCERETAWAFEQAGGQASICHVNDLLARPEQIHDYDGMAFPGGFSFGDDLGSGQVLAIKLRHQMSADLKKFIAKGSPIIGICNGFQVLTKLGMLPDFNEKRQMALAPNIHGRFINRWVNLERVENAICKWTTGLSKFELPVRHGEGRVVFSQDHEESIYQELLRNGQVALRYTEDINGSYQRIAGVTDKTGTILGLMPHPEAYLYQETHPKLDNGREFLESGAGLHIFKNIVQYCHSKEDS